MEQGKSNACFHTSYNRPHNKLVVKNIMDKLTIIITIKRMLLAFLVGDHTGYVFMALFKAEKPNKYRDICERCLQALQGK